MPTPYINSIVFTPQFDTTKDLVITLDYSTSVPVSAITSAKGGVAIGVFNNSTYPNPNGGGSVEAIGTDFGTNLLNVFLDFDGVCTGGVNAISVYGGSNVGTGYNLLTRYSSYTVPGLNISSSEPKRIRVRVTDFGNTVYVDNYNFTTSNFSTIVSGSWYQPSQGVTQCPFTSGGVFVNYCYNNTGTTQSVYISNINLNGQFTSSFINLSTSTPV